MTTIINASTVSGLVNSADTSGILQLQTASTAAVTITAAQNVGIGTSSPAYKLDVAGAISTNNNLTFTGTGNRITGLMDGTIANRMAVQTSTTNANTNFAAIPNGTGTTTNITGFNSSDMANASFIQLSAAGATDIRISSGITGTGTYLPMTFFTGGSESLRLSATTKAVILAGGSTSANGTGIAFPATQSASSDANTLDDYEEGTFTPAVAFGGGTTGITYSTQVGQYVKIGRFVYATFNIALTNKGSSSGSVTVTGLPFSISGTVSYGICIANTFSLNSTIQTVLQMPNGGTVMDIKQSGTDNNIGNTDFTNSTQVRATVAYTSA